ncbi:carbohydrate ABC transporter permease [Oleiharenicola lentus]|uniref:carbohydrate ABC transporter permease n=1 Tax=Oleiharenicola lentus TaxID=2508720 RepID=UPI003F670F50
MKSENSVTGLWRVSGFLLPALGLFAVFVVLPALSALVLAFFRTDGLSMREWVGLDNFQHLLGDALFWRSIRNLLLFAVLTVPVQTLGPLIGAKLLYSLRSPRAAYWYRTLLVFPVLVPGVVTILVWQELYGATGPINLVLNAVGLGEYARAWLGDPATVVPAIVAVGLPFTGGVFLLIYLAGFLSIPASLVEAARLDGAGPLRLFLSVELPMLRTQIGVIALLALLGVLQNFDNIQILTNGGPMNASLTPALYLFRSGFEFGQLGYASALGVVLLLLCALLTLLVRRVGRKDA